MIYLIVAFAILFQLFNVLLKRPKSATQIKPGATAKPSKHEKLSSEAFQYATQDQRRVLILYATEYGFAREVATRTAEHLSKASFSPRIVNVLHFRLIDLTREKFVIFICSTTGDGVPPNEATDFRDALVSRDLVVPPHIGVSILALGDRGYPHFCRAGKVFEQLIPGGSSLTPRVDVDQEDWLLISDWMADLTRAIETFATTENDHLDDDYLPAAIDKYVQTLDNQHEVRFTRNEPYMATVTSRQLLTANMTDFEDAKEVIRIEFDISGSGIQYSVGDAVGIVPKNNTNHVTRLLQSLASNGDEPVSIDGRDPVPFETALQDSLDICTVKPELIAELARHASDESEHALAKKILGYDPMERSSQGVSEFGKQYLAQREVFDILSDFVTATMPASKFVTLLRPLYARYYSISSTPITQPDSIAATVDVLRYTSLHVEREGVASTYLRDRCRDSTKVGLFVSKNPNFRLPKDTTRPIVMIGPGTGIAPFIAFIEQRAAQAATGANWLFFGCRHEAQDFLYRERLQEFVGMGALRLETAFSRDGKDKVYVQHRMAAYGQELWQLLESEGAHVYVCGDGGKMAADVDEQLHRIVQTYGERSVEEAKAFIINLLDAKRYQRDVWVS